MNTFAAATPASTCPSGPRNVGGSLNAVVEISLPSQRSLMYLAYVIEGFHGAGNYAVEPVPPRNVVIVLKAGVDQADITRVVEILRNASGVSSAVSFPTPSGGSLSSSNSAGTAQRSTILVRLTDPRALDRVVEIAVGDAAVDGPATTRSAESEKDATGPASADLYAPYGAKWRAAHGQIATNNDGTDGTFVLDVVDPSDNSISHVQGDWRC